MKILWIVNTPIGPLGKALYGKETGGAWMDALLADFKCHPEQKLVVATTAGTKILKIEQEGITYYALPDAPPISYGEDKPGNIAAWRQLLEAEKPDAIQVWGTEFTHGLCALRIAKEMDIPAVIYMQGYLGSIARHYFAGISYPELKKSVTFRDFLKRDSIIRQQKKYAKSREKEQEMLTLAGNIISENDWCDKSIAAIVPEVKSYHCPLSINRVFFAQQWQRETAEPHSIICTASGYPLKGLHILLRAVHILKKGYPDVKLYVPGDKQVSDGSLQWLLRKRGYTKYIEKLVKELGLEENICWLGRLRQEELAKAYTKASVFVLPSSIENHSSSLKEAMAVGVPSVASAVGGVPEYVEHGENGLLYRFEEYDVLAGHIAQLFENPDLGDALSQNARKDMKKLHADTDMYRTVVGVYEELISRK